MAKYGEPQPTIEDLLVSDYDNWRYAFKEAGADPEGVAEVLACKDGVQDDEEAWVGLFLMKTGVYMALSAGCDSTGWDCRASGSFTLHSTLDEAIAMGLDDGEREDLGVMKERKSMLVVEEEWKGE